MSAEAWVACALVYFYMMVLTYLHAVTHHDGFILSRIRRKAPTYESKVVVVTFGSLLWPVWFLWHSTLVFRFIGQVFKGLWKMSCIYGKGIRDLLPRKGAKIPEARVLTKDLENG